MSSGEIPNYNPEVDRQATYDFCEEIRRAADLANHVKELGLISQRATSAIVQKSMFGNLPFVLEVDLPGSRAASCITKDDHIINPKPERFVATEMRSISDHRVEFYNRLTNTRLRIEGFDFDVFPVFDYISQQPDYETVAEDLLDRARPVKDDREPPPGLA